MNYKDAKLISKSIIDHIKETSVICSSSKCIFWERTHFECTRKRITIIDGQCVDYKQKEETDNNE